jgi:exoribonuclease-2
MTASSLSHRAFLQTLAERALRERGLRLDFSPIELAELDRAPEAFTPARDLRAWLWCSIDNPESRDLDQLTVAEALPDDQIKVLVAIADVDAYVPRGAALDERAHHNTVTLYTPAAIFPMLPPRLSTDLTSLNFNVDRLALVVEMIVDRAGAIRAAEVFQAWVRSRARLAYGEVATWLTGDAPPPAALAAAPALMPNLRLQAVAADRLQAQRHRRGALSFETVELAPGFEGDTLRDLAVSRKNAAQTLIENFMIAANAINARFLAAHQSPSIRRVVHAPKRWDRIARLAAERGATLPPTPDSGALETFLQTAKAADPARFPDLSLAVIKLLGGSEYVAEWPSDREPDHFGLALNDYTHSTAPNRRYTDLITQRLIKAVLRGAKTPYAFDELQALARHCTVAENTANKIARQISKSAVALLFEPRVGETFDALVTGAAPKGTWVRLIDPPIEGRLVAGANGVDVGDYLRVRLVATDAEQGFIDFGKL